MREILIPAKVKVSGIDYEIMLQMYNDEVIIDNIIDISSDMFGEL